MIVIEIGNGKLIKSEPQNIEYRISNFEGRHSVNLKDRAKRYQPSKFCGSVFEILRFAVKLNFIM